MVVERRRKVERERERERERKERERRERVKERERRERERERKERACCCCDICYDMWCVSSFFLSFFLLRAVVVADRPSYLKRRKD